MSFPNQEQGPAMEGPWVAEPLDHPADEKEWPNLLVDERGDPSCLTVPHRVHRAKTSTTSPPGPEGTRRPEEMEIFFFLLLLFFKYELFPAGRQRDEGHWRPPATGTQPAS